MRQLYRRYERPLETMMLIVFVLVEALLLADLGGLLR